MDKVKLMIRDNQPTEELYETINKAYRGRILEYTEVYYLDYAVDEETGMIHKNRKEKFYTKDQVRRNREQMKNAFL